MKQKFRILSLAGGGLRGLVPVLILKEIERRTGTRINKLFDLVSGTSTGGLIACGLTVSGDGLTPRYTLDDLERVYVRRGNDIFPEKGLLGKLLNTVSSLRSPKFCPKGIQNVLSDMFGNYTLQNCLTPVFITSYDLINNEAILFKTRKALADSACNAKLIDVCRATSAAPTYLPAYDFTYNGKERLCVDGGLYMNNPAVGALVEFSKYHAEKPYNRPDMDWDEISVLSLGTGHYTPPISVKKVEGWGLLGWAPNITEIMMQAINQTASYETHELVSKGNFLRVNITISDPWHSSITDSSEETQSYLEDQVQEQVFNNSGLMAQLDAFFK